MFTFILNLFTQYPKYLLLLTVYLSKILRVVYLAFCSWVSILASLHLAIAGEPCVGHLGIDGVVLPCNPWDRLTQVTTASKTCSIGTASSS